MRKLLLLAAVMCSLSGMAQTQRSNTRLTGTIGKNIKLDNSKMMKMDLSKVNLTKTSAKAPAKASTTASGETKTYFIDYRQYGSFGFEYVNLIPSEIVFGENNAVYMKNMIYPDEFNVYLDATVDGNVISIADAQVIGTYQDTYDIAICNLKLNWTTGAISLAGTPYQFTIDEQSGVIENIEDEYYSVLGLCALSNGEFAGYFQFITSIQYMPTSLFGTIEKHDYSYAYEYYDAQYELQTGTATGSVDVYNLGGAWYIKGLMPEIYPNPWIYATVTDTELTIDGYQSLGYGAINMFYNNTDDVYAVSYALTYDATADTYNLASGSYLIDAYIDTNEELQYDCRYSNLSIKKTASNDETNAIESVEDNKEVVSTAYFDLSGRRINNAQKGINIMVKKFADGTTKAVKVMK